MNDDNDHDDDDDYDPFLLRRSRATTKAMVVRLSAFAFGFLISAFAVMALSSDTSFAPAALYTTREHGVSVEKGALPEASRLTGDHARGMYLTGLAAGSKERREYFFSLLDTTELNAVVIDVKDSRGWVTYDSKVPAVLQLQLSRPAIRDVPELLVQLRTRGVWTIARLPVFQDTALAEARPELAVRSQKTNEIWRDRKGLAWIDPASPDAWAYNIALSREALSLGFDEVQLDYIRFPSDGDIRDLAFPFWEGQRTRQEVIKNFFAFFREKMGDETVLSVDLFGMTMLRTDKPDDDLGIGQRLVDAVPYFDYISPMVYPSHYPPTFEGFLNPAAHPGEVVAVSLRAGMPAFEGSRAKLRPWLQDFHLGARYTPALVRAQIDAAEETGASGWLLWNPASRYTEEALRVQP